VPCWGGCLRRSSPSDHASIPNSRCTSYCRQALDASLSFPEYPSLQLMRKGNSCNAGSKPFFLIEPKLHSLSYAASFLKPSECTGSRSDAVLFHPETIKAPSSSSQGSRRLSRSRPQTCRLGTGCRRWHSPSWDFYRTPLPGCVSVRSISFLCNEKKPPPITAD
jgi:hypothetical protein